MAMDREETLEISLETHPRGKKIFSSGMEFVACGEQDVGISLVSAALPLEMESNHSRRHWGRMGLLVFCVVGAAPPPVCADLSC